MNISNKKLHFTFWDFVKPGEENLSKKSLLRPYDACAMAQAAFDKYLKEHGKFVWGFVHRAGWHESKHYSDESQYRAMLINVEDHLDSCKHPKERISFTNENGFKCICGAKLEPETFKEMK